MRESFIVVLEKNNGYPSFETASEFSELKSEKWYKTAFISYDGKYPEYIDKNFNAELLKHYSECIFFIIPQVNDGYPIYLNVEGLHTKIVCDIYSGDDKASVIYYNEYPVRKIYLNEKQVYQFGYEL